MIWVEGQFPHCSNRMCNGVLFSDSGLRIQRFGNELFIAHPTFQFNWDVRNIKYYEMIGCNLFYFKKDARDIYFQRDEVIIIFITGHVSDHYPYQFLLTKEEYTLFRDFIIGIIK